MLNCALIIPFLGAPASFVDGLISLIRKREFFVAVPMLLILYLAINLFWLLRYLFRLVFRDKKKSWDAFRNKGIKLLTFMNVEDPTRKDKNNEA